jgi:hypothetical protein
VTVLQTARERALTCTAAARSPCFGTYSAQQPGWAHPAPISDAARCCSPIRLRCHSLICSNRPDPDAVVVNPLRSYEDGFAGATALPLGAGGSFERSIHTRRTDMTENAVSITQTLHRTQNSCRLEMERLCGFDR